MATKSKLLFAKPQAHVRSFVNEYLYFDGNYGFSAVRPISGYRLLIILPGDHRMENPTRLASAQERPCKFDRYLLPSRAQG